MRAGRITAWRSYAVITTASTLAVTLGALGVGTAVAGSGITTLISKSSAGVKGDAESLFPSVSADGRYVAFRSDARNLHPDDIDGRPDVFVRDRVENKLLLISRADGPNGEKGDGSSFNPRISADGRRVVFRSRAPNLDPDDTDKDSDLFVRNLITDQTTLVSRASGADGEKTNGESFAPAISADGRVITFRSAATNLDPADTDPTFDIYVRDLNSKETTLISRASGAGGAKGNAESNFPVISGDASLVAYRSESTNLDPADKSDDRDIYARELATDKTIIVSRGKGAKGKVGNSDSTFASISENGRYVAFDSLANNLTSDDKDKSADVLRRDLKKHRTILVSRAGGLNGPKQDEGAAEPTISADGRYVAFHATGTNLGGAEPDLSTLDVFVRDTKIGRTILMSQGPGGKEANKLASEPWISADGSVVAFHSEATNLSKDDNDGVLDVFVREVPPVPKCQGKPATQMATDGGVTRGSNGRDVIVGNPGADNIKLKKGSDRACGNGGKDRIDGGPGGDLLSGAGNRDLLEGGKGRDRLRGGRGADRLKGGAGPDKCNGGPGRDKQTSC